MSDLLYKWVDRSDGAKMAASVPKGAQVVLKGTEGY